MQLKDFIGQTVRNTATNRRFRLTEITSPIIGVQTLEPDADGHYTGYVFHTIHGDPFANGTLVFENRSLLEPFKAAYAAYCRTTDAYWEEYGYWLRKD